MNTKQFTITNCSTSNFRVNYNSPYYSVLLFQGNGTFSVDFVQYSFSGNTILFLSPCQNLQWLSVDDITVQLLQFHADFYCIEYHKKEVACNGLLFNNIYLLPHITTSAEQFVELKRIIKKLDDENKYCSPYSDAILKSYLQLILALCSKEKHEQLNNKDLNRPISKDILTFQKLLDTHFYTERNSSFYAEKLAMSTSTFSKKIKHEFGKTPTNLIKERVILESKKLLHLTNKSVKEIAYELHFEDQFYFSRYFKKAVGISPTFYRKEVGISSVAEKIE